VYRVFAGKYFIKKLMIHLTVKYFTFFILIVFSCFAATTAQAERFAADASYSVCFTPGGRCATRIVNQINKAQHSIQVLAYSFTSKPIATSLVDAKKRGVNVEVILDKTQASQEKYSSSTFLDHAGISIWIDYEPSISHNKVMIIDGKTTITGSFNFTRSAQSRNAENVLIIHDKQLTEQYIKNWQKRKSASQTLTKYKAWQKTNQAVKDVDKRSKSFFKVLKKIENL
jgi:phosphatidylserine/phosphatidylglycerophosphate/cardiolipin synthase-like enzyme